MLERSEGTLQLPSLEPGAGGAAQSGQTDQWRWRGRWVRDGGQPQVEYLIHSLQAGRFRVRDDAFELRDARGTSPLRARTASIAFHDRITTGAAIVAVNAPTRLLFEAVVPIGTPVVEFQAPRLLVGGSPLAVPPLRFERQMLEAGRAPPHC
jgi:hypothetical protein